MRGTLISSFSWVASAMRPMRAFPSVALALLGLSVASDLVVVARSARAFDLGRPIDERSTLHEDYYLIGPGDILNLSLFDAPELSGKLDVLNDGTISLPLVGNLRVSGLTLQQAADLVKQLLSAHLLRPELQLSVFRARPVRVSVVGEVERPGLYSLTSSETAQTEGGPAISLSGLPSVIDAIQKAGGITQQANLKSVRLQRRLPGESISYKQTTLNLLSLVLEGDQQQNPLLFDGDILKLETAEQLSSDVIELASANLSPKVIEVNVIGEVNNPGRLNLMANTPLVQAILAAGGLKDWRANSGHVELVRINRNGSATLKRFNFDMSKGASEDANPPLREGDTVRVRRSILAKGSDAIGAVSKPVTGIVTILSLYRLLGEYNND